MKRAIAIGMGGAWLLVVGAVEAQAPAAPDGPVITRPNWVKRPNGADLAAVFPAEARRKGQDGRATISCKVTVEGTLARCQVVQETPAGSGYGFAALSLAPLFQMTPETVDGKPVGGSNVRVPIVFKTGGAMVGSRGAPSSAGAAAYLTRPIWTQAPTRAQVAAAYPPALKSAGGTGRAALDCALDADGSTRNCVIVSEEPVRSASGRAALLLARGFRVEPVKDADGKPVRNARVRIPFAFSPTVFTADAEQIARPEWGRLPEAEQVADLFPAKAKAAGVTKGDVLLSCEVKAGGGVTGCTVARETPAGMGFGEAALALAPSFAMSAWTSDGRPVDGARVRIPIRYEP